MNLDTEIVVNPDPIKRKNGSVRKILPIKLSTLKFTILDDVQKKECAVRIVPFPIPLVLWSGVDYDHIGDYTQAQVENRIIELLGDKPADVLKSLMPKYDIVVK